MHWARDFYSKTGKWWSADNKITEQDLRRVSIVKEFYGDNKSVLDLGSSYGNTAAAFAQAGYDVVGIELSDRFDSSSKWLEEKYPGSIKFLKDDFYTVDLDHRFDIVTYWNGFGIGTDEDQKRLLKRIADDWLKDEGVAFVDVYNINVWRRWSLDKGEQLKADPARGYFHNVSEEITIDEEKRIVTDSWWEDDNTAEKISQKLKCYDPQQFKDLLNGTGLKLDTIIIDGKSVSEEEAINLLEDVNNEYYEYLVKLQKI